MNWLSSAGSWLSGAASKAYDWGETLLTKVDWDKTLLTKVNWTDVLTAGIAAGGAYYSANKLASGFDMPSAPATPAVNTNTPANAQKATTYNTPQTMQPATVKQAYELAPQGNETAQTVVDASDKKKKQLLAAKGNSSTLLTGGMGLTDEVGMSFKTLLGG